MAALSDRDGGTVEVYRYDVFGRTVVYDGDGRRPRAAIAVGNPYFFTGRRLDFETGLYYYRARMVSPHLGRFLQTDPIGYADGINWYAYVGNNPVIFVDPWGLKNTDKHMRRRDKTVRTILTVVTYVVPPEMYWFSGNWTKCLSD